MTCAGSVGSRAAAPRVLVVDPERDIRESLGEILAEWGYQPLIASNGREALNLARAQPPSSVVSELELGDLAPEVLLGELRRNAAPERPACIALTSWCRTQDRLRAGRAGFDRLLFKPADLEELHRLLVALAWAGAGEGAARARGDGAAAGRWPAAQPMIASSPSTLR